MKNTNRMLVIAALTVVLVFTAAARKDDPVAERQYGAAGFGNTLTVSGEQVWDLNRSTNKISEVYFEFKGNRALYVTDTSSGQEIIHYIYADSDCRITGSYHEGYFIDAYSSNTSYFTQSDLDLSLKAGWNAVCRKETFFIYGVNPSGRAGFSMNVVNPLDLRWAIYR